MAQLATTHVLTSQIAGIPVRISIEVGGTSQVSSEGVPEQSISTITLGANIATFVSDGLSEHFGA